MNCPQCGSALPPSTNFCGACGFRMQAPPQGQWQQQPQQPPPQGQWQQQPQQPPPQGQWQPPPQQQPPQGQWQQQPQQQQPPQGQWQQQPPPQGQWQQQPPQQAAGPGSMRPYPLIMHRGMTRLTGHMVVAPMRLFFICSSTKGGLATALGKGIASGVGGLVGAAAGAIVQGAGAQAFGAVDAVYDEPTLHRAAQENEGSLVMEPPQIKAIKDTFWTHALWFNGLTYAFRSDLGKELKYELGFWCQHHNVKHAGLLPK